MARFASSMTEVMSSEDEDDLFSFDEEGEHNVENIMWCSIAQHACSPLLRGFLHEEELCKVALTCHSALDVVFSCQGLRGETPWPTHSVPTELVGQVL